MKKTELISVIIPVYNVYDYVGKCIESVINQTYKELEIIVINDGSTDNSLDIIKAYEKKDKRIKVIDKKNGGLSDARNVGIDASTGKYIMFLDSDDFIDENMIKIMYENLKKYKKKISICNRYYYYEDDTKKLRFCNTNSIINMDLIESLINLLNFINFDMSAWAKLYDKSLFENIRFPVGKLSEDYYIMYLLFDKASGVVYDSRPLLYYLQQRKGSITKKNKLIMDYVYAAKQQHDFIKEKYPQLKIYAESSYCLSYFTIYNKSIINGGSPNKNFVKEMNDILKLYEKSVYKNKFISNSRKIQIIIFKYFKPIYNFLMKMYKKRGV